MMDEESNDEREKEKMRRAKLFSQRKKSAAKNIFQGNPERKTPKNSAGRWGTLLCNHAVGTGISELYQGSPSAMIAPKTTRGSKPWLK